jgi:hypothetical protein
MDIFKSYLCQDYDDKDRDFSLNNSCLISGEPLDNNHIILDCKHKFNINELYNEVVQQKTKYNLYSNKTKIKYNEIKCPYCRIITPKLLPYFKYYNNNAIYGVNCPQHLSMQLYECEYKTKKNGNCGKNACVTNYGIFCNNHIKYTYNEEQIIKTLDEKNIASLKKKTIKELKDELKKNSKKTSGNKDELIIRLALTNTLNEELINGVNKSLINSSL